LQMWTWVSAVSPDGNTVLAFGDPNLQSYTLPNPMLAMAGFREGSLYNGGGGTLYVVSRYRSGQEFAAGYGQQVLPRFCTEIRQTGGRDRADIGGQFSGGGAYTTVGEARFTCRKGDMPMEAYVFCATSLFMMPPPAQGAGFWYPSFLYGFLAPQKLAGIAAGVAAHMLASIEIDPQWVARQSETNMAVSRIATTTGHAMSNTIMQGWEERGAAIDRVMEEGSRARLGVDIYSDPATGNRYTVENTHRYYWVNPQGSVVGTDTDTPPAGFERLQRVPPSH
jgi:hypothetical protein